MPGGKIFSIRKDITEKHAEVTLNRSSELSTSCNNDVRRTQLPIYVVNSDTFRCCHTGNDDRKSHVVHHEECTMCMEIIIISSWIVSRRSEAFQTRNNRQGRPLYYTLWHYLRTSFIKFHRKPCENSRLLYNSANFLCTRGRSMTLILLIVMNRCLIIIHSVSGFKLTKCVRLCKIRILV